MQVSSSAQLFTSGATAANAVAPTESKHDNAGLSLLNFTKGSVVQRNPRLRAMKSPAFHSVKVPASSRVKSSKGFKIGPTQRMLLCSLASATFTSLLNSRLTTRAIVSNKPSNLSEFPTLQDNVAKSFPDPFTQANPSVRGSNLRGRVTPVESIEIKKNNPEDTKKLDEKPQDKDFCALPTSVGGWHEGRYVNEITSSKPIDWRLCAAACAEDTECEFWTLRIHDYKSCVLMADKGAYHTGGFHVEGDRDENCADMKAPVSGQDIKRIFYINLDKNVIRRQMIESKLAKQDLRNISVERVAAKAGGPEDTCRDIVGNPDKCRGVAGLALTNIDIIQKNDLQDGLTLVLEDDAHISDIGILMASTKLLPDDWDVVRWNCDTVMQPPEEFEKINDYVFRTKFTGKCEPNENNRWCEYYGGTIYTMYTGEGAKKLEKIWATKPFFDVDGALTNTRNEDLDLKSYCIKIGDETAAHRPPKKEMSDIQVVGDKPLFVWNEAVDTPN